MATPSGFSRCHLLFLSAFFVLSSCAVSSMPCMISSRCSMVQSLSSSLPLHIVLSVCSPSSVTNSTCPSLLACFARSYCSSRKQLWCAFVTTFACPSQYAIFCPCSCHGSVAMFPTFCLHAYSLPFLRREKKASRDRRKAWREENVKRWRKEQWINDPFHSCQRYVSTSVRLLSAF